MDLFGLQGSGGLLKRGVSNLFVWAVDSVVNAFMIWRIYAHSIVVVEKRYFMCEEISSSNTTICY